MSMEGQVVMALLDCPVCQERLDSAAEVLPRQLSSCHPCLQRQEPARPQLLCPECRAPDPVRTVEELPTRALLEGLHGSGSDERAARSRAHTARGSWIIRGGQHGEQTRPAEVSFRASMRNQHGDPAGELLPLSGHSISPKHKVDPGDACGSSVPADMLQAVGQTPHLQQAPPAALCRALCAFNPEEMNLEESAYYLHFLKGDVLTVVRRVDENWIEAKLGDRGGICPLQFIEPNSVAAKLLEGKSQRGSDLAQLQPWTGNQGKDKATDSSNRTTHYRAPQTPVKTTSINGVPHYNHQKSLRASSTNFHHKEQGEPSNNSTVPNLNRQGHAHQLSVAPAAWGHSHPSTVNSQRTRRHSDSTQRHLLPTEKKMANENPPKVSMALLNPQMYSASADTKNSSTQQLSISVCAVMYSYKPRRPEELELRKGEMVGVYGKFKEGWLRGLSLRTGKVGILPSNYITPVLRTSARLLENKAPSASSQHNAGAGRKPAAARGPAVVLALDRVNTDGTIQSAGQVPSGPNGAQAMSSSGGGKSSFYGASQGWDTVRRIFNPHRGSDLFSHSSNLNVPSNSQHFAQVQASGYSPALQRKKNVLSNSGRQLGWMTEPAALSTAAAPKDRDFNTAYEAIFHHDRQQSNGPQSILIRPDALKNTDKPTKSVRFLTDEDPPPPRHRTSSWSSGSQVHSNSHPGPPPLEVWAPSLTLGRDGPGIILKEGKAPCLRKGLETAISDLNSNPQKFISSQPSIPALSAQFSPSRHRVTTTHLAQADSELSLLQGEFVLVHRPRPDGRVLVTQESSGQTGLFHSSVLQALERLS